MSYLRGFRVGLVRISVDATEEDMVVIETFHGLIQRFQHRQRGSAIGVSVERCKQVPLAIRPLQGQRAEVAWHYPFDAPSEADDVISHINRGTLFEKAPSRQDN